MREPGEERAEDSVVLPETGWQDWGMALKITPALQGNNSFEDRICSRGMVEQNLDQIQRGSLSLGETLY